MDNGTVGGGTLTLDVLEGMITAAKAIATAQRPLQFIASSYLTITKEDWSKVRSIGRAKRRRSKGLPQKIAFAVMPDPKLYRTADGYTYGHPMTIKALQDALGFANA